jgi:hypothetical protein
MVMLFLLFSVLRCSQQGDGYHNSTKSSNHHDRPQHHRHHFHQVLDRTGLDVLHHSQPNVYNHHGDSCVPLRASNKDQRYTYGDIPKRREGKVDECATYVRRVSRHYQHHYYTGNYRCASSR